MLRGGALLASAAVLVPLLALIVLSFSGHGADWAHLARNVLPVAVQTTFWVMAGVALLTASMGIIPAWLTAYYDFPGRRILVWALVLPLAVPTYLAAYAYAEFFTFTGPPQTMIRHLFGFSSAREYWFPDVRSLWGAVMILSVVLYPYVYLTTRAGFLMQGRNATDVARTLGASPMRAFFQILLPMTRPAIIIGVTLALMETLNDVGAVEYLGVKTLTSTVYTTWLNQGSLSGAAQIACVMLVVVLGIILAERWARRRQRFNLGRSTAMTQRSALTRLDGLAAAAAATACLLPIIAGFGLPFYVLERLCTEASRPAFRSRTPGSDRHQRAGRRRGRFRHRLPCLPPHLCGPCHAQPQYAAGQPFRGAWAMRSQARCWRSASSFRWRASTIFSMDGWRAHSASGPASC